MLKYKYILFDLDGTLVDSGPGITGSVEYALTHFGITGQNREQLTRFIGPPLVDSFMRFYGFTPEQAGEAVDIYRADYRARGVHMNTVYPGICELLQRLNAMGCTCCIATSKPEVFANTVADESGLCPFIKAVYGAELDDKEGRKRKLRMSKEDVIAYALACLGNPQKQKVLMVGDRRHDIEGARANGTASCGVLFGFGSRAELEAAGATYIVSAPKEISDLILGAENEENIR